MSWSRFFLTSMLSNSCFPSKAAMNDIGVTGMTVTNVLGCGVQHGAGEFYRGAQIDMTLLPKIKVESS